MIIIQTQRTDAKYMRKSSPKYMKIAQVGGEKVKLSNNILGTYSPTWSEGHKLRKNLTSIRGVLIFLKDKINYINKFHNVKIILSDWLSFG